MAIKYQPGGVTVAIGRSQDVSIPTRVFRGRATCMHFDTDKSFLLPPSMPGVRNIVQFYARHAGMTMLINGHTDLVGDAQYNLQLSLQRANAVSSYLQNKVDDWLTWYQSPVPSKRWSYIEDQNMLATLTDSTGAPYYAGAVSGVNDAATQAATRRFQSDNGLTADGQLGPDTRRALVAKYMAIDGTSLPPDAKLEIHGCGKFHPIDPTTAADQGNRRVEIFLFDGPVDPAPQDPCPSPGCTQYPQWVGNPLEDIDLCAPMPAKQRLVVTLLDPAEKPRAGVAYTLIVGTDSISNTTDDNGRIDEMIDATATTGSLRFDDHTLTLQINALQPIDSIAGAQGRLSNLGYAPGDISGSMNQQTADALRTFQSTHDLPVTGANDAATQAKLEAIYGS